MFLWGAGVLCSFVQLGALLKLPGQGRGAQHRVPQECPSAATEPAGFWGGCGQHSGTKARWVPLNRACQSSAAALRSCWLLHSGPDGCCIWAPSAAVLRPCRLLHSESELGPVSCCTPSQPQLQHSGPISCAGCARVPSALQEVHPADMLQPLAPPNTVTPKGHWVHVLVFRFTAPPDTRPCGMRLAGWHQEVHFSKHKK